MKTLARPPLLTTTTGSTGGVGYLALQVGSSAMSIFGLAGAAPVNLTVPVTAPCASTCVAPATASRIVSVYCVSLFITPPSSFTTSDAAVGPATPLPARARRSAGPPPPGPHRRPAESGHQ